MGFLLALIINHASAHFVIPSAAFFIYYIPHVFEFGVVIYLFKFGYVKKDFKCIPVTVGATVVIYTVVHFINLALIRYCEANEIVDYAGNVLTFNYMFSMTPDNPVLALFWKVIPVRTGICIWPSSCWWRIWWRRICPRSLGRRRRPRRRSVLDCNREVCRAGIQKSRRDFPCGFWLSESGVTEGDTAFPYGKITGQSLPRSRSRSRSQPASGSRC